MAHHKAKHAPTLLHVMEVLGILFFLIIGHTILSQSHIQQVEQLFLQFFRTAVGSLTSKMSGHHAKSLQQGETADSLLNIQNDSLDQPSFPGQESNDAPDGKGFLCTSVPKGPPPIHFIGVDNCKSEQVRRVCCECDPMCSGNVSSMQTSDKNKCCHHGKGEITAQGSPCLQIFAHINF
jgi:hypothetical protein